MKNQDLKYYIWVIGCQMNRSDAERVSSVLEGLGYQKTEKETKADLIVVLACSVRQSAIDRIYGKARKWNEMKKKKNLTTVLSGCVLEADRSKMKKVFDIIFDTTDLKKFPLLLSKRNVLLDISDHFKITPLYQLSFQAFIPIMTGCNNFCTYCAVPYTKGREKSRSEKEILNEIEGLVNKGYKEITLLGQNVNSYGNDLKDGSNFTGLLNKVNIIPGKFWIRFLTSNPQDMSSELIKALKECEKVTENIHLPVQTGNDEILKKMNRKYTRKHYLKLVSEIEKEIPNIAISTDTIVGFPGETKKQFGDTVSLYEKVEFDMAFIAQYSSRLGTAAAKIKDDVSKEEKKEREKKLTEVLKKTSLRNNKKYIGETVEVLVERQKKGYLNGRTRTFKLVQFEGNKSLLGKFIKVKIASVTPWAMKGKVMK